jgi:hypothetical protein
MAPTFFVATWVKREHCHSAMEKATNIEAISAFLAHVCEEISMEFGDIVGGDRVAACGQGRRGARVRCRAPASNVPVALL